MDHTYNYINMFYESGEAMSFLKSSFQGLKW
jgi:hypothetical protein